MKARLFLVDDHRMFLEGLAALFGARDDIEVVGSASNGRDAIAALDRLAVDLVLIDVGMPELNGIETVRLLRESVPGARVLALSGHQEHRIILEMLRAGAVGYVPKCAAFAELVEAVRSTMEGRVFISPSLSGDLVMALAHAAPADRDSAFSILTSRELEILQAVTEGHSTKEIAAALSISVKTVETHRQQIMEKLDIHSVAELTRYAIREDVTPA